VDDIFDSVMDLANSPDWTFGDGYGEDFNTNYVAKKMLQSGSMMQSSRSSPNSSSGSNLVNTGSGSIPAGPGNNIGGNRNQGGSLQDFSATPVGIGSDTNRPGHVSFEGDTAGGRHEKRGILKKGGNKIRDPNNRGDSSGLESDAVQPNPLGGGWGSGNPGGPAVSAQNNANSNYNSGPRNVNSSGFSGFVNEQDNSGYTNQGNNAYTNQGNYNQGTYNQGNYTQDLNNNPDFDTLSTAASSNRGVGKPQGLNTRLSPLDSKDGPGGTGSVNDGGNIGNSLSPTANNGVHRRPSRESSRERSGEK
jgi:hypothetical protein